MEVLQNSQNFRVLWRGRTELTDVPGTYNNTAPVSRVFVALAYRTYRSSGYGCECPTELTKVPGTGNTWVKAHPLGGGVRFEVEESIEHAWHVLTGQRPRGNPS